MRFRIFLAVFLLTTASAAAQAQVVTLNKGGSLLTYDCTEHTATRYYTLRIFAQRRHRVCGASVRFQARYDASERLRRPDLDQVLRERALGLRSRSHGHVQPHGLQLDLHRSRQFDVEHRAAGFGL